MNNRALGATALTIYNSIEGLAVAIEKAVNSRTWSSANFESGTNLMNEFESICILLQRKTRLVNLKLMIEEAMMQIGVQEQKMLILKFFDRFSNVQICNAMNMSKTSLSTHLIHATSDFGAALQHAGLDDKQCTHLFEQEDWVKQTYSHFLEKQYLLPDERIFSMRNERIKLRCI